MCVNFTKSCNVMYGWRAPLSVPGDKLVYRNALVTNVKQTIGLFIV